MIEWLGMKPREVTMYRKFVSAVYVLNIIFQSFFNLALPIGLSVLCSRLIVEWAGAPGWIYAPLVIAGVVIGFISMIKFILSAMRALERLEAERSAAHRQHREKRKETEGGK